MGLCAIYSGIMTILIAVLRNQVGYIFTNAPKVVALCAKISVLAAIYQLPDAVYGVFSGVLRSGLFSHSHGQTETYLQDMQPEEISSLYVQVTGKHHNPECKDARVLFDCG